MKKYFLVCGGAGFIGSHMCELLTDDANNFVICIDNFSTLKSTHLQSINLSLLSKRTNFKLYKTDITKKKDLEKIISKYNIDTLFNFAAKPGVLPSLKFPKSYIENNFVGTQNLLDCSIKFNIKKFIFASTAALYGNQSILPFHEQLSTDYPLSPYAVTKKSSELLIHSYSKNYNLNAACIRFFNVYGPRQKPQNAIHKFTHYITNNIPIPMYNHGLNKRDYVYIDDLISGINTISNNITGYDIVNLGISENLSTVEVINIIEKELNKKSIIKNFPAQKGEAFETLASISYAKKKYGYSPKFNFKKGIKKFIKWYKLI